MKFNNTLNTLTIATDTKSYSAYELGSVVIDNKYMVASDSYCIYIAEYYDQKDFAYPIAPGESEKPVTNLPIAIPTKAINKAFKNAPKKTSVDSINNIICVQTDEKAIKLHTTDLESYDTVSVKNEPINFPDYKTIIKASETKNSATFTLSRQNLEKLVKMIKSQDKDPHARVSITVPLNSQHVFNNSIPVKVEFNDITGYLMTMLNE